MVSQVINHRITLDLVPLLSSIGKDIVGYIASGFTF